MATQLPPVVGMGVLQRSDSMSECPYKGAGQYCFLAAGPNTPIRPGGAA